MKQKSYKEITKEDFLVLSLPQDVKSRIFDDLVLIKTHLQDDIEYANNTINYLLLYNSKQCNSFVLNNHLHKRYPILKEKLKQQITIEHFNECGKFKNAVFDLVEISDNQHELLSEYSLCLPDTIENSNSYVGNQIADEIKNVYNSIIIPEVKIDENSIVNTIGDSSSFNEH